MDMILNVIAYVHLLVVFELKLNFTSKYFINNIINQIIDQFNFKSRLNNTAINSNFENNEFGHTCK
jgi:hypothetical protein